jgi:hypothetical protein
MKKDKRKAGIDNGDLQCLKAGCEPAKKVIHPNATLGSLLSENITQLHVASLFLPATNNGKIALELGRTD